MILEQIAKDTRNRVEQQKQKLETAKIRELAESMVGKTGFPFEKALGKPDLSFICEVKKASPSKGIIAEEFPYLQIAKDYETACADAISCLTEPKYFLGADAYLDEIAKTVNIPVLRKDFTIDAYQIYEAKVLGASAVLLICALLEKRQIKEYLAICDTLGMSALVEAHDESEVCMALDAGARIIGVNNRNLKNFHVDVENSTNLRKTVPQDVLFVAESGITGPKDIERLIENQVDAVLIGETMMKSKNKTRMLSWLKGESESYDEN